MSNKKVHIIGGGTVSHVRTHMALTAPAYGETARKLYAMCKKHSDKLDVELHLTKMACAGKSSLETNEDVAQLLNSLTKDDSTKIIFMNAAMCDFEGFIDYTVVSADGSKSPTVLTPSGKYAGRLSSKSHYDMSLMPAPKVIKDIRNDRKDIFLIGFKTTTGMSERDQYLAGLDLLKRASCNLVLANDVATRTNMIITPEEATYHVSKDRDATLKSLVEMAYLRSHLTFTRSTIIAGDPVPWNSELVPNSLREVVDYCIARGAYKPFNGSTVGHFAVKLDDQTFLTSKRKTNFNDLKDIGLVKVKTDGPDHVIAYGSKPSVGGQSQRIVFSEHPETDCIVHFHCPIRPGSHVPTMSQREFECGSHECGQNTSTGLKKFDNLFAVYLDNHGPNIVFNRNISAIDVIWFIEENFDLTGKTGGYLV